MGERSTPERRMRNFDYEKLAQCTWDNEILSYVENKLGTFTKQEVLVSCPTLGSSSVENTLKKLTAENVIQKIGSGKNTQYVRNPERNGDGWMTEA